MPYEPLIILAGIIAFPFGTCALLVFWNTKPRP